MMIDKFGLAVLIFRIYLLDRPEYRLLQLPDLRVRRIPPDFLQFPIKCKQGFN